MRLSRRAVTLLAAGGPILAAASAAAQPATGAGDLHDQVLAPTDLDDAVEAAAGQSGVTLREVRIDTRGSTRAGHAIQINAPGANDWTMRGLDLRAKGYGLLVNTRAGGSNGLLLTDFRIRAQADAIELNTPGEALRNTVVWGGHLTQEAGAGPNAGFGFGVAHVDGLVAGGFIIHGSRLEAVHVEDGSRHVVLSSFAVREAGRDGVRLLPAGSHPQHYRPAVVSAFSLAGTRAPGSAGIYCVLDRTGVAGRSVIVGGTIADFEVGLWLDGAGLYAADQISVENVTAVIRLGDGARALGSFVSRGASVFVRAQGSGMAGQFHQEDAAPRLIVERLGPGVVTVEGFSYPVTPAGGSCLLFPAPVSLRGRLTIQSQRGGGFWEADVLGDREHVLASNVVAHGGFGQAVITVVGPSIVGHAFPPGRALIRLSGAYTA